MTKKDLKLLIGKNKTKEVIKALLSMTEVVNDNDELFDEVILLSSRHEGYSGDKRKGILNAEESQLQINRINHDLLLVIQKLPDTCQKESFFQTPQVKGNSFVELLIDQNFSEYNSSLKDNLVNVIAGLLQIERNEIIVRRIISGSTKVLIEMPKDKSKALLAIFMTLAGYADLNKNLKIKNVSLFQWMIKQWLVSVIDILELIMFMILFFGGLFLLTQKPQIEQLDGGDFFFQEGGR